VPGHGVHVDERLHPSSWSTASHHRTKRLINDQQFGDQNPFRTRKTRTGILGALAVGVWPDSSAALFPRLHSLCTTRALVHDECNAVSPTRKGFAQSVSRMNDRVVNDGTIVVNKKLSERKRRLR
jgi:hypothetical protein